jgi:uncharacterized repeat protein (TIGR01451 family)
MYARLLLATVIALLAAPSPAYADPGGDAAIQMADVPDPVSAGGRITYVIQVRSNGPEHAEDVELRDPVPAGTRAVSATTSGVDAKCDTVRPSTRVFACDLGDIPRGASVFVALVVRTSAATRSPVRNVATVEADEDPFPGNNSAAVTTTVVGAAPPPAPPPPPPPPPPPTPPPAPPAPPPAPPAAPAPDLKPPAQVTGVRATTGHRSVLVRWRSPADADFQRVQLMRSSNGTPARVVYSGRREQFADRGLRNGVRYLYELRSLDRSGNASAGVRFAATPKALPLFSPQANARLTAPPVLRWRSVPGASYYNVQLYRGKTKILTAWPGANRLKLRARWMFAGRRIRLAPGVYHWFVWPGRGSRSRPSYGPMLGRNSFVVVPPRLQSAARGG